MTISETALDRAVEQAIISADQAVQIRRLAAALPEPEALTAEPDDPEKLRFITGFGDIFVALGIVLFLVPSGYFVHAYSGSALAMWLAVTALAWMLAEFFTRRRRMALPSILLLIIFVGAGFAALLLLFAMIMPSSPPSWYLPKPWFLPDMRGGAVAPAALASVALATLHYWQFRVPITLAAGAGTLCLAVLAAARLALPDLSALLANALLLVCGILIFLLAMRFDMSDPARATRRTDIAFWLHLLAAPLIVHPLIRGFLRGGEPLAAVNAAGILAVFLLLGAIAVLIDRRAILVSGLVYAGIAFGSLVRHSGLTVGLVPTTFLALGLFVLLLSAGWQPLRRLLLGLLPVRLARRLPHPLVLSA